MQTLGISLAFALFLVVLIPVAESAQKDGLADRVAQLEAQVAAMEDILRFVRVESEPINGLAGPHWIFEGPTFTSAAVSAQPMVLVPIIQTVRDWGTWLWDTTRGFPRPRVSAKEHTTW